MVAGPKHGGVHQATRAVHLATTLATGRAPLCCYCGRLIPGPTKGWDLAHAPGGGYHAPGQSWAHPRCNRAARDKWSGRPHPWSRAGRERTARRRAARALATPAPRRPRALLPKVTRGRFGQGR